MNTLNNILTTDLTAKFGISSLKSEQRQAIHALMAKRDVMLFCKTGYGKSLPYQSYGWTIDLLRVRLGISRHYVRSITLVVDERTGDLFNIDWPFCLLS